MSPKNTRVCESKIKRGIQHHIDILKTSCPPKKVNVVGKVWHRDCLGTRPIHIWYNGLNWKKDVMSSGFDPHLKWLGVKPKHQPPNHYRLLGIDLYKDDARWPASLTIRLVLSRDPNQRLTLKSPISFPSKNLFATNTNSRYVAGSFCDHVRGSARCADSQRENLP